MIWVWIWMINEGSMEHRCKCDVRIDGTIIIINTKSVNANTYDSNHVQWNKHRRHHFPVDNDKLLGMAVRSNIERDRLSSVAQVWLLHIRLEHNKTIWNCFVIVWMVKLSHSWKEFFFKFSYGWWRICCRVSLLSGSACSIPRTRFARFASNLYSQSGASHWDLPMFSNNRYMLSPSNGYCPVVKLYLQIGMSLQKTECTKLKHFDNLSYNVTPLLQMSTLKPRKVSCPFAISGGWNAGDPCPVVHVSSSANISSAWYELNKQTKKKLCNLVKKFSRIVEYSYLRNTKVGYF